MLLVLHDSLLHQLDDAASNRECAIEALDNIAKARREGKHILFGERGTLQGLATTSALPSRVRATYSKVLARLPQKKSLKSTLVRHVLVVSDNHGPLQAMFRGSIKVIQVPVRYFADSMLTQETLLLSENHSDTMLYKHMAKVSAYVQGLGSMRVFADGVGGGGSTTAVHYASHQRDRRRFCLCVVDSDSEAPSGSRKGTALSVLTAGDPDQPLCECRVIGAREVENLIPTDILSGVIVDNRRSTQDIELLERLEASTGSSCRNHLDFKSGTTLRQLFSYGSGTVEHSFWRAQISTLASVSRAIDSRCVNAGTCRAFADCTCHVMQGFGQSILENALSRLRYRSPQKIVEGLCTETRPEWENTGELILAWCCGSRRLSAI